MNKRGLSGVITTVILIGIGLSVVGIVWFVLMDVVNQSSEEVSSKSSQLLSSCSELGYDKVESGESCYGTEIFSGGEKCCDGINSYKISGLVGYWNLDDGSGNTARDKSGNGNDGVLMNSPIWTDGVKGKSLNFNLDDSQYVEIDDADEIDSIKAFSAWVKPIARVTDAISYHTIASKHTGWNFGLYLNYNTNPNKIHIIFQDSAGSHQTKDYEIPDYNEWYHAVGIFRDDGRVELFINGESQGTSSGILIDAEGSGTNMKSSPIRIGGTPANRYSTCIVDEVRVYNRALTEEEVKALYNAP
jgi:hypothetical protein